MTYTWSIIPQPPRSQWYLMYLFQSWEAARNPMGLHFPALNTINSQEKMCTSVSDVSPKSPPLTSAHSKASRPALYPCSPTLTWWAAGCCGKWPNLEFPSSVLDHGLDTDYLCDLEQVTEHLQTLQVLDSSSVTGSYLPHWVSRGWNALWRPVQI